MKKRLFALMLVPAISYAEPIKPYFDVLYPHIKQCVLEEKERYKPAVPVKNKADLKAYLKALLGSGYYVIVDTKDINSKDICYMEFEIKKLGYVPKYLPDVEKLVVAVFERKKDAEDMKRLIAEKFKLKTEKVFKDYFTKSYERVEKEDVKILKVY